VTAKATTTIVRRVAWGRSRDTSSIVLLALALGIALASKFLLVCLFAPLILISVSMLLIKEQ
jgi:hypothetical protein